MNEVQKLITIARRLNSPGGCPWDLKQNFKSLQRYLIEESQELLEAVDEDNDREIIEELGDVLYIIIFYCMIAEKEGRFTLEEMCAHEAEKLTRRHPHVFGEAKAEDANEALLRWNEVKGEEAEKKKRKSLLDGIPKGMDLLARGQKVMEKISRHDLEHLLEGKELNEVTEEGIGESLIRLVFLGHRHGFDVASSMRRALKTYENAFRSWEENKN
ncbi:MAG: nucleoside triphosphate pyrophosphohydrolase [Chlamydiales bacterium]